MSLQDRLVGFADFLGIIPLGCVTSTAPFPLWLPSMDSLCFLLPLANSFHDVSSHAFCSSLEFFSVNNNIWNFWHNILETSQYAHVLQRNWCSLANLFKYAENLSAMSNKTSAEWNLYLFWSSHLEEILGLKRIFHVFLNIKTIQLTPKYTKGIFSLFACLKSMWDFWREVLSRGLNCK